MGCLLTIALILRVIAFVAISTIRESLIETVTKVYEFGRHCAIGVFGSIVVLFVVVLVMVVLSLILFQLQ